MNRHIAYHSPLMNRFSFLKKIPWPQNFLKKIPWPQNKKAQWGAGAAIAIVVLGAGTAAATMGWFNSVEQVPFEGEQAVEDAIDNLEPEVVAELSDEFEALEAYGDITDQELLAIIEEARLNGRLVDRNQDLDFGTSPELPDEDFETILIIGADESGALADVLIYLIEPTDGSMPLIVSIPRDLYVESPCTGLNSRINANLNGCGTSVNGPTLVSTAVGDFTGINVDHFATFDFDGFADVVNTLGGVELCFDYPTRDRKAHLDVPAGCFNANGTVALGYVRSRQTEQFVNGSWQKINADDFSRQDQQQEVLFKLLAKLNSFGTVTSFAQVAEQVASAVRMDDTWTLPTAVQAAWDYRDLAEDNVTRVALETENYRTTGGAAVLLPTASFGELFADAMDASETP